MFESNNQLQESTTIPSRRIEVAAALATVLDPEVGVNVVDLGLVYAIDAQGGLVSVAMTMTSAGCPLHGYLVDSATKAIRARLPEVSKVDVEIVSQPEWNPAMMSLEAKRQLGWAS